MTKKKFDIWHCSIPERTLWSSGQNDVVLEVDGLKTSEHLANNCRTKRTKRRHVQHTQEITNKGQELTEKTDRKKLAPVDIPHKNCQKDYLLTTATHKKTMFTRTHINTTCSSQELTKRLHAHLQNSHRPHIPHQNSHKHHILITRTHIKTKYSSTNLV